MAKFTKLIKYSKYGIAFSLSALLAMFFPSLNNTRSTNQLNGQSPTGLNTVHADAPWVGDGGYGDVGDGDCDGSGDCDGDGSDGGDD